MDLRRLVARARTLLAEARRRHAFRAVAVYAAAAFVGLQGAALVLPALPLPERTYDALVVLALLGLPVALAGGWIFDLGPRGLQRTAAAAGGEADVGAAGGAVPGASPALRYGVLGLVVATALATAVMVTRPLVVDTAERSVAVLPFADLSPGGDQRYLADGVAEDLMTHLSTVSGLRVVSRTSVLPYRDARKPVADIGEELGVAYVLEGSVRRAGDRIRITAQLIDARRDEHMWAESFDRRLGDLFAVQTDIATRIGRELQVRLTEDERRRIRSAPTGDMLAYDEFLRGRDFYHRLKREANETAVAHFRRAVARDPDFALAHAWLGAALAARRHRFGGPDAWLDSAAVAAGRALELDPDLPDAHRVLGTVAMLRGRLREGAASLARAVELNPSDWAAAGNLGSVYGRLGRLDEAVVLYRQVAEGDPVLVVPSRINLGVTYTTLGFLEAAEEELRAALALAPDNRFSRGALARLALRQGRAAEATALAEEILADDPDDPGALFVAADVLLGAGEEAKALEVLERLHGLSPGAGGGQAAVRLAHLLLRSGRAGEAEPILAAVEERARADLASGTEYYAVPVVLAEVAAVRGDADAAVRRLRQAVRLGLTDARGLSGDPVFERIRDEPGFRAVVAELERRLEALRARLAVPPEGRARSAA